MPVVPDAVTVIVLAAGGGSRLGGGKLLLPWRGKPILAHTVAAAVQVRAARAVFVVIGHDAGPVREAVAQAAPAGGPPVHLVENPEWRRGQASSLRCGVAAVMAHRDARDAAGAMIVLGDQPLVRPETLNMLAERHLARVAENPGHLATAPFLRGKRGTPAILSPDLYPAILRLEGDVGARHILAALGEELLAVPVDDPAVVRDVDTPDDYAALRTSETTVIDSAETTAPS